ncbi:thioredoxin family protein [Candidatus Micrarchaeota archaeon]|nr:thioredoxin family protein [Candidatus Micrarchaeota archaeon]MBU1166224.1 thioredoxin family protein [Candidatus Micrarchaeota archaeon]MBU1886197.1 thioredoxin family protein [Candidatus Micrarchaeota archaeon]
MLTPSNDKVLCNGSVAPEFELPGVDGKTYSLAEFKGKKAILIIFMCNHCPYVVPKMPYFVELQEKYGKDGLQIIALNSNDAENYPEDSFEKMKEWADKEKFNFPYLYDETQQVATRYGATCTPDPFLFNKEMKLEYHGRFDDTHGKSHSEAKTSEMEDAIKQLLKGNEVIIQQIPSMGCNIKWK